jgi:ketol-acid reductoisomerase
MNDILDGTFSSEMMKDWDNDDKNLLKWREETGKTLFEKTDESSKVISNQEFFDHGILMIAFVKSGVELAFETMVKNGIIDESAYYESLHELPLIANLVARKKLYEMNRIISDTAEYGCYLFNHKCLPLLSEYVNKLSRGFIGEPLKNTEKFDIALLKNLDEISSNHPIEKIGKILRKNMSNMKKLK